MIRKIFTNRIALLVVSVALASISLAALVIFGILFTKEVQVMINASKEVPGGFCPEAGLTNYFKEGQLDHLIDSYIDYLRDSGRQFPPNYDEAKAEILNHYYLSGNMYYWEHYVAPTPYNPTALILFIVIIFVLLVMVGFNTTLSIYRFTLKDEEFIGLKIIFSYISINVYSLIYYLLIKRGMKNEIK